MRDPGETPTSGGREATAPSPDEVRSALERLVARPELARSGLLTAFLRFVVEERLAGRGPALKGYTIATMALGRAPTFDPNEDPIVRVTAHRLRRVLSDYYRTDGAGDALRVRLPTGTYSPVFERSEVAVEPARGASRAVAPVVELTRPAASGWDERAPLLVAPWVDLDGRASPTFCRVMTERVTNELARHRGVAALATSAATPEALRAQAEDLGVRHALEARVGGAGGGLRVALSLADPRTGERLWGDELEVAAAMDGDRAAEQELAATIASHVGDLQGELGATLVLAARRKPAVELSAAEVLALFAEVRGRSLEADASADFELVSRAAEHALRRRPSDATLTAIVAVLCIEAHAFAGAHDHPLLLERARGLARRALALDPDDPHAHLAVATVELAARRPHEAMLAARRALARAPRSGYVAGHAGWALAVAGAWDEGLAAVDRAGVMVARTPRWHRLARVLADYRAGDDLAVVAATLDPELGSLAWGCVLRAAALGRLGHLAEGRAALDRAVELAPGLGAHLAGHLASHLGIPLGAFLGSWIRRTVADDHVVDDLLSGLARVRRPFEPPRLVALVPRDRAILVSAGGPAPAL